MGLYWFPQRVRHTECPIPTGVHVDVYEQLALPCSPAPCPLRMQQCPLIPSHPSPAA